MRTFFSYFLHLSRSFFTKTIFPLEFIILLILSLYVGHSLRRSCSSSFIKQGWLQHFLSWISKLFKFVLHELLLLAEIPFTNIFLFFSYSALYIVFWMFVISTSIIVYCKGGIDCSTSSFILLNMYGFKVLFKLSTWSLLERSQNCFLNSSWFPNLYGWM